MGRAAGPRPAAPAAGGVDGGAEDGGGQDLWEGQRHVRGQGEEWSGRGSGIICLGKDLLDRLERNQ